MSDLVLSNKGFGERLYDRFPPRYREDDIDTNFALRRYLEATAEGGFNYAIDEWNGILDFANPDQVSPQVIPILFKQFGLEVFNGIPEIFLRYLLPRLGMAWSKKGGMDVVEFVASSIIGVKATTKVYSKPNGDANVDIRLYMDIAITDQMPDFKQFLRIIYHFLPFYLDMRVVFVYAYHDKVTLVVEPCHLDKVTYTTLESGFIAHTGGEQRLPLLYPADKLLNIDFILNEGSVYYPDPDVFFDRLTHTQLEPGVIQSRWAPFRPVNGVPLDTIGFHYYGGLNSPLHVQNRNLYYNDMWVEVDQHFDVIKRHPLYDLAVVKSNNDNDHKVDHVMSSFAPMPTLNTDFVLNDGFLTNLDNSEWGQFSTTEVCVTSGMSTTYATTITLDNTDSDQRIDLVKTGCDEDTAQFSGEDTYYEVINTVFAECGGTSVDEEVTRVGVSSKTAEVAVFMSVPALCGLLTNTDMVLNTSGLNLYDGCDTVQYHDGTKEVVFF